MRFVIVGAGRVGMRTARVLRTEGHEVVVVEPDPDAVERAREAGFEVVEGDGSREAVLERTGIEGADALGALTGDLNVNFAACMIGKHYGCRTVMRIDEDYREAIYREHAEEVDAVIYPERLGAIGAKNAILGGNIRAIADVAADLQVMLVTIPADSPMRGYTLSEVELPGEARLLAFGKADEPLGIPLPDDSLETGDRVAVLAQFAVLDDIRQLFGERTVSVRGGG